MDTKQRILDEALTLFSERGYANVFVNDIAEKVGIKAPSLYKHYKNKQAIFDADSEKCLRLSSLRIKILQGFIQNSILTGLCLIRVCCLGCWLHRDFL